MKRMFTRIFKKRNPPKAPKPLFNLQLDLTSRCNFHCRHCYQKNFQHYTHELALADWEKVLAQYKKLAAMLAVCPALTLSGGEPLLCDYLWQLIETVKAKHGIEKIYLLTNGSLIDQTVCEYLQRFGVEVQLSIEGPSSDTNDHIRGDGAYQTIMNAANLLQKNDVPFTYQMVLRRGFEGLIEAMFSMAKETGACAMNFVRLVPSRGNAMLEMSDMLEGGDLKSALEQILFASRKYAVPTNTNQPLWCLIDETLGHPSSAGFLGLTVDPSGKIHVTSRTDYIIGNATEKKGLINAYLENDVMRRLRKGGVEGCGGCEYFKKCRGDRSVSYVLNGDFFGPDKHCWYWQGCGKHED